MGSDNEQRAACTENDALVEYMRKWWKDIAHKSPKNYTPNTQNNIQKAFTNLCKHKTPMDNEQQQQQQQQQNNQKQRVIPILCEECKLKEFKYKCPACSRRTCSLSCVNSHKQAFACTGKKNASQFVPLSQFDDSTLLSDYNLLEDVKRVAESAQRMRVKLCGYHPQFRMPFYLKALRGAAAKKETKILFLPSGMTKREKNRTSYNQRKKFITWTIEWRFHSTEVVLLEHGVHENTTIRSVIEKHLQPSPWRNKLRRFCEESLDNLKLFIRKYHKGNKAPYLELDLDTPLNQLFQGLVILEYPVIHVFLSSDKYDFEVVKDFRRPPPTRTDLKKPETDDTTSHVGVTFKEEEIIEDDEAPEPHIIDLLKLSELDEHKINSNGAQLVEKQLNNLPKNLESPKKEVDGVSCNVEKETEILDVKMEDIDFDEELINAYSFLMEESNPDDFLDSIFEGEGGQHLDHCANFADVEELEDGEIPN